MRRVYVPLGQQSLERLIALAKAERRRPQDQAACLLEQALRELEQRKTEAERCHN